LIPPFGAGPVRLTFPVDGVPPTTDDGFRVSPANEACLIVSVEWADEPEIRAKTDAAVVAGTGAVENVKLTEFAPAAIITVEGPPQAADDEVNDTFRP
jgi:hypothetical protein